MTEQSYTIINTGMTVEAMRDSGYKSTTHALAEIIDNAIEADADAIEVFGVSRPHSETGRITLSTLAVLDNGKGMDEITLRRSLRYGDGTRQGRNGIGRFGVGLPNSSLSQATRVDIWSWQSGPTNALHTYLSIEYVQKGAIEIPQPVHEPIPDVFIKSCINPLGDSGTLVVWNDLDRVEWKRASTVFKHTEILLGRIYRRFLAIPEERLHAKYKDEASQIGTRRQITLIPVVEDGNNIEVLQNDIVYVRPNDPLYIMSETSCPEEFGQGSMFSELEASPFEIPVNFKGQTQIVRVRASYAKAHVRDSSHPEASWPEQYRDKDAGHAPWGKHADSNMGVSMMRAHRELELDSSWINGNDPTERWWTIEVDFPTLLDEVFGVTNNKQGTVTFQRLAKYDWRREAIPGEETPRDVRKRMEDDGDYRVHLLDLRDQINNAIKVMRQRVKESRQKRSKRHGLDEDQKADAKATAAIKRRLGEGHKGSSDIASESGTEREHTEAQVESLVAKHRFAKEDALRKVAETIEAGNRVRWIQSHQSSPAFFDIDALPGVIQVALNIDHPVHSHLYDVMHPDVDELSEEEVRDRLYKAAAAFRVLIYSWARYEDEQTDKMKRVIRDARIEWGKYAEEFFDDDDGSVPPTDII